MSLEGNVLLRVFHHHQWVVGGILIVVFYAVFISHLSTHPAGSYLDESCEAYNGYLIAQTGTAENGVSFPLFFQCYTEDFTQWMSPELIYMMAGLYSFVPPSVLSARIFSATIMFLATLLLGLLATRVSGRSGIGTIVALTAMATPWIFDLSRLIQETTPLIFFAVLFLLCLHRAYTRAQWTLTDCFLVAISLSLVTYAYAAGRVLGPVFGFGLLIFAVNRTALVGVLRTWILYGIAMVPFFIVYFTNPAAISGRFLSTTNMSAERSILSNVGTVALALYSDISLNFFVFDGDANPRHHIPAMGEFLIGTFALAVLGILIVLLHHRSSTWWRFVLFGSIVSLLPGSVTLERHHALRGAVFPVFIIILTIPAVSWLLGHHLELHKDRSNEGGKPHTMSMAALLKKLGSERLARRALLCGLLAVTALQGFLFQMQFLELGDDRGEYFDEAYPRLLARALADGSRPIYLVDGTEPAYIHALWYGTIQGLDLSNFVHLLDGQDPPYGALVLGTTGPAHGAELIEKEGSLVLYRNILVDEDLPDPVPDDTSAAAEPTEADGGQN